MVKLSVEEGTFLVKLARKAVKEYLENARIIQPPPDTPEKLFEKAGVFVTIEEIFVDPILRRARRELRGCIGYPEPFFPMVEATIRSAIAAATEDPRFPPLTPKELDRVVFEVSILTKPQELKYTSPEELPEKIKIGRDGLIIEQGIARGLLLPQVAVDEKWGPEEFLSYACLKAGLREDEWRKGRVKVYVFQSQIFVEATPEGEVVERLLEAV
jgi:uncharacterized protein (TIGR00296 family)